MTRLKHHRPGIYPDLSYEDYAAIPAYRNTLLRKMGQGPRECWHYRRVGSVVTPAMKAGSLAHIQVLDPASYLTRVVEWDVPVLEERPALKWDKIDKGHYAGSCGDLCAPYHLWSVEGGSWRPVLDDIGTPGHVILGPPGNVTAGKAACKEHYEKTTPRQPKLDADGHPVLAPQNPKNRAYQEFVAANPGREPVTRKDLEQAKRIGTAVRDNPEAAAVLSGIWATECTVVWPDPETGVLCKARLDWLTSPHDRRRVLLGDLKTCRNHAPPAFPVDAARREYHAQMAWYRTGLQEQCREQFGTEPEIHCVLLAVQNSGSHDSTVYDLDDEELRAGDELNSERLQRVLECEELYGERPWPGKCHRAPLDLAQHASWALGDDDHGLGGPRVDFGDIPK